LLSEPVWTFWRREKPISLLGSELQFLGRLDLNRGTTLTELHLQLHVVARWDKFLNVSVKYVGVYYVSSWYTVVLYTTRSQSTVLDTRVFVSLFFEIPF
jgi:hypothetical protein